MMNKKDDNEDEWDMFRKALGCKLNNSEHIISKFYTFRFCHIAWHMITDQKLFDETVNKWTN